MDKVSSDVQLGRALGDVKHRLLGIRKDLYKASRQCACCPEGLCVHHAGIVNKLSDAVQDLDQAITIAYQEE